MNFVPKEIIIGLAVGFLAIIAIFIFGCEPEPVRIVANDGAYTVIERLHTGERNRMYGDYGQTGEIFYVRFDWAGQIFSP